MHVLYSKFATIVVIYIYLVSITSRVTPVPIPNTTVKPLRADDTSGEALRESKSSPVIWIFSSVG